VTQACRRDLDEYFIVGNFRKGNLVDGNFLCILCGRVSYQIVLVGVGLNGVAGFHLLGGTEQPSSIEGPSSVKIRVNLCSVGKR
jgi:hypothetical protein